MYRVLGQPLSLGCHRLQQALVPRLQVRLAARRTRLCVCSSRGAWPGHPGSSPDTTRAAHRIRPVVDDRRGGAGFPVREPVQRVGMPDGRGGPGHGGECVHDVVLSVVVSRPVRCSGAGSSGLAKVPRSRIMRSSSPASARCSSRRRRSAGLIRSARAVTVPPARLLTPSGDGRVRQSVLEEPGPGEAIATLRGSALLELLPAHPRQPGEDSG
jgi:hypothetical protein